MYIYIYIIFCYILWICDLRSCKLSGVWIFPKIRNPIGSFRIPLQNTIPLALLVFLRTRTKSRALHLCCKWKLVPPASSSLATLISRQNRCALRCRVVPTGRVHWFTLWATGLLLQRVYECIRMNKTRVVRLVGIDSGSRRSPLAKVESGVPPRKCAHIILPENAEIESLRSSAVFRPLFLDSLVKSIIVMSVNMLPLYLFSLRFSPETAKAKLNCRWLVYIAMNMFFN